jgi:prepilin-type N-terminal cleavage/methylation domain-containing protein
MGHPEAKHMQAERSRRPQWGFTMPETVIVVAIIGIVAVFAGAYLRSITRREQLKAVALEVQRLVLATRAEAVKRKQACVMLVDPVRRTIKVWADSQPNNYVQDAGEPTLIEYSIPPTVHFRSAPAGELNGPNAVCFDGYLGNPELVDRIVFKADGALDPPQASDCQAPRRPALFTGTVPSGSINCPPSQSCRGLYISDSELTGDTANRNTFRISVDDARPTSEVTLLKWVPIAMGGNGGEVNYSPPPWKWVD